MFVPFVWQPVPFNYMPRPDDRVSELKYCIIISTDTGHCFSFIWLHTNFLLQFFHLQVLLGVLCPNYLDLYDKYCKSAKMQAKFRVFQQTFDYVSRHSGLNVQKFQEIYQLYFGISTESEYGLTLPSWLDSVWPDTIIKLSIEEYYVSMGT